MNFYSILSISLAIAGFFFSVTVDTSTMSGEVLLARIIMVAGASIATAILAHANKTNK